ncbi:MAG: hypothetical protein IJY08_01695 [Clostridia bacterium]|nr:hypothetical protein [Clostridia bacterium]
MKKIYNDPAITFEAINLTDVITASGYELTELNDRLISFDKISDGSGL